MIPYSDRAVRPLFPHADDRRTPDDRRARGDEFVHVHTFPDGRRLFINAASTPDLRAATLDARLDDALSRAPGRSEQEHRTASSPVSASGRRPTPGQQRAVADAIELFHEVMGFPRERFAVRWVDPDAPEPGFPVQHARALTAFFSDHSVVCLRLDQQPDEIFRSMSHELQHVRDADSIRAGTMSHAEQERRAEHTAAALAALR